jgi:hypothetical protein
MKVAPQWGVLGRLPWMDGVLNHVRDESLTVVSARRIRKMKSVKSQKDPFFRLGTR